MNHFARSLPSGYFGTRCAKGGEIPQRQFVVSFADDFPPLLHAPDVLVDLLLPSALLSNHEVVKKLRSQHDLREVLTMYKPIA